MADDPLGPEIQRPAASSLSESLLLEALNRLNVIERQNMRNATQNETIIAAQQRAEESRGTMHTRLNEISVNVAALEVHSEQQGKRLDVLDPIVTRLNESSIEGKAIRKAIAAVVRNSYARAGGAALAGGALWHQWEGIRDAVLRILGMKVGGP